MQRNRIEILIRRYSAGKFDGICASKKIYKCISITLHLQIINVKDPNWWQAKHIGNDEATGLIPSQELEERRKAFVPPEADYVHTISICGTRVSTSHRIIFDSFVI